MADYWYGKTINSYFLRTSESLRCVLEELKSRINLFDKNDWSPLHCAAYLGCGKMTRILLDHGADVNATNGDGYTPLHLACHSDDAMCIRAILDYHPIINVKDGELNTPLIIFIRWSLHDEILLERLLAAGADPNISDKDGYSPLHYVAEAKQAKTKQQKMFARVLIQYNADVNIMNRDNNTPLHLAITKGFEAVVEILLENGAYLNTENVFGFTQLGTAFFHKIFIPNIVEFLGKYLILRHSYGVHVNINYLNKLCEIESLQHFKDVCDRELLKLKSTRVSQSDVTYHDILISTPEKIAKFLRNSDILESLADFKIWKYDIFRDKLVQNVHEALKIYRKAEIGYKFCRMVFPVIPDICIDEIIGHLSNEDMGNLAQIMPH